MKKLAFFSILLTVFVIQTSFADTIRDACYSTKNCGAKTNLQAITTVVGTGYGALAGYMSPLPGGLILGGVGGYVVGNKLGGYMSKADIANEYLYFNDGSCLECDDHQIGENYECPNGTIVSNGSAILRCETKVMGDRWTDKKLYPCPSSSIQDLDAKGTVFNIKAQIEKSVNPGVAVFSGDACFMITCGNGGTYDKAKKECVADVKSQEQKDCEAVKGNTWNASNKTCVCPDNKKWDKVKKQCLTDKVIVIPKVKPEKSIQCDDATMKFLLETKLAYPTETDIQDMVKKIIDYCTNDENRLQVSFDTSIIELKILIEKYENAKIQKSKEITDSANNIKLLYGNISGLKNEASVWKDKEGDFNKSRLISDSVAGVVLGTAGGLITSSVIKKNQTENGFEDISCTVGGQVVAGWNDEFTVGIR